jgi:hypothetical protein
MMDKLHETEPDDDKGKNRKSKTENVKYTTQTFIVHLAYSVTALGRTGWSAAGFTAGVSATEMLLL